MRIATLIARNLLGLMFLVFGLNGFLHFIPQPPPTGLALQFLGVMTASHFMAPVFLLQVVGGALLLANRLVPLALVLLGPVIVNILLFHILMAPAGIGPALLALALWLAVFNSVRSAFAGIFATRVGSREMAPGGYWMQLGVDSFAAAFDGGQAGAPEAMRRLLERIEHADQVGLDVFGVGEHHRREFLDSAPAVILAAAAARTRCIRLTSAVSVLSAADPVRVFQSFATLDLISQGRAEMVVGRGSFTEAFPLFGLNLRDYDSLFTEKLDLLLNIRDNEHVHWSGRHRAALTGQGVYPRPEQPMPVWLGVGGTPASFVRAGTLGLPLMVAIIGGETHRFRPLVDLYREAGRRAGHPPDRLKVGLHSLGYVAETTQEAADDFFPGHARIFTEIGRERGRPPVTRADFDAQRGPRGAFLIGSPEEVAEKILRHSEALGGLSRVTFQMDNADLPHAKLMRAIELLGTRVAPALRPPSA